MFDWQAISDIESRVRLAKLAAPMDPLTKITIAIVKTINAVFILLVPVQIVTTGLGGCLIAITFGLFIFVLQLIWWPLLMLLLTTSWLWLEVWYLRPIIIIPGILIAVLSHLFVMLAPEPERDAKYSKLALTEEWPLSWYLMKPPVSK